MKTPEEYYAQARTMFFAAHPDFQSALDELTESDARQANLSLAQLRDWHAERIYAAFLRQKKLDGMLFSIQLAEPDKAVAADAIEKYLKSHAEALGMTWEEFCIKNELYSATYCNGIKDTSPTTQNVQEKVVQVEKTCITYSSRRQS
jgi:hypothetical protein